MSDAADASGLSFWIGDQLNVLKDMDPKSILIIIMVVTALVTELASNTACANVIIPILLTLVRVQLPRNNSQSIKSQCRKPQL